MRRGTPYVIGAGLLIGLGVGVYVGGPAPAPPTFKFSAANTNVLQGDFGETITVTSTSEQYCSAFGDQSSVTKLDAGVPCLTAGGLLVEGPSTNLNLRSEEFDNAHWTKAGAAITANDAEAPDGETTADLVTLSSGSASHWLYNTFTTTSGKIYTMSVWAKSGTADWVALDRDGAGNHIVSFDLSDCSIGTETGTVDAETSGVGDGWCRVAMSFVAASTAYNTVIKVADTEEHVNGGAWTAAGTETVHIWGAQAEELPFMSSYIPTTTGTATRNGQSFSFSHGLFGGSGQQYCIAATVSDLRPTWWTGALGAAPFINQSFVTLGQFDGAAYPANYADLKYFVYEPTSTAYMRLFTTNSDASTTDGAVAETTDQRLAGGEVRAAGCYNGAGEALSLFVDKVETTGGGPTQTTVPATAYMGTFGPVGDANYSAIYAHIKDVCVGSSIGACQ